MSEPSRPPVALLVIGLLLITLTGLLIALPVFKCPVCTGVVQRLEAEVRVNPAPGLKSWLNYARTDMPCGYCDQRRKVTLPVWYQAKYRR